MGESSPFRTLEFGHISVQVQVAEMTEANMKLHLAEQSEMLRTGVLGRAIDDTSRGIVLVDGSCELIPPPTVRKLQADWLNEHRDLMSQTVGAMGFIVPGTLSRGALQAALWLAPLPMPSTLHESLELALDWAIGNVDSFGGDVSQDLLLGGSMAVMHAKLGIRAA